MKITLVILATFLAQQTVARDVPPNVRSFYNRVKGGRCEAPDKLQGGFYDHDGSEACTCYPVFRLMYHTHISFLQSMVILPGRRHRQSHLYPWSFHLRQHGR